MTRLFLVRHGPTHAKSMVGWSDLPADLSDRGKIAALSRFLPDQARLVSSDLSRTRATADALSAPGRLRLPDAPALRELHFGDWELKPFAEIDAEHPDLSRHFWTEPGDVAAPNGESWNQMAERVQAGLAPLMAPGGDLIVVAHFAVILSCLARFRGVAPAEVLSHKIAPLSVTCLDYGTTPPQAPWVNHEPE
ncbi:histidine phosphatase family protein [Pseudooceanicola sp. CBS1P-1]|uniref:Histidine phosphatase family protein n=1 Tax=Pseudooceanicola albus TaxID=2692189 RepID=A0A6L7G5Z5_9RHOB|nr:MULTISPECIES: histidine phosphatase family protein [Pseudooceanicola]MBT9384912.1 histidine phosphatase family protein [Pseudooceanicola endophyticus]MXN18093.1 histidine phosphatase family protein [Pseudooceanicola albus]